MENIIILVGVLAILGIIGGLVYVGLREDRGIDPLQERLAQYEDREMPESLEEIELGLSFKDRIVVPLIDKLAQLTTKFTPQKQLESTRHQLELAGQTTDPTQFFLQRIVFTIVFGLVGMLLGFVILQKDFGEAVLYTAGGLALGNYFPILSLRSKIKKRQDNIVKALPDALDLLTICVEAGLGFDAAMGKVYEKWDNELALAFGRVLREIQLGKPRRDGLKDMADRMDVPDVNVFTAAIIQSEQLGVSMSKILRYNPIKCVQNAVNARRKKHNKPLSK